MSIIFFFVVFLLEKMYLFKNLISIFFLLFLNNFQKSVISYGFPVAQMVEHGTSNAKIMGSIPRESKS